MYQNHFGLTHAPLGKDNPAPLWDDGRQAQLKERFQWLLDSPGIGLMTGEAGVGKTALLRQLTEDLNPHRYHVVYSPETDFSRIDIYRGLALALGLEPAYRRAQLWRDLKQHIQTRVETQQQLPIWIIDEAQNLPTEFFRDFPAFLNFAFDTRNLMTVWLVGLPVLANTLSRAPYAALNSRIQMRLRLQAISDPEQYKSMIEHAFKSAGCQQTLLSDTGYHLLRQATQGNPRTTGLLLITALNLAAAKGVNHLPDDLLQEAIEVFRS
jgi:MSHA biogenesis protein MshM